MSNIQIAAKAELFGAPIDAAFISNETQNVKGISNKAKTFTVSAKTVVVYGKPEVPISKKLTMVLEELTFGLVDVNALKTKLPDAIGKALDGIDVAVNQVYFKKTMVDLFETSKPNQKEASNVEEGLRKQYGASEQEYALWIDINIDPKLMAEFPVKVTTLSFKIWSTGNKKVLEEMKITDIQKLLAGAGVATDTTVALQEPSKSQTQEEG